MEFRIAPTPALEQFGGLPEDDPNSFIDLNQPGLSGTWLCEGDQLFVLLENEIVPAADDALVRLLRERERADSGPIARDRTVNPDGSYGRMYLQERGPELIHIEYLVEQRQGEAAPPDQHPIHDVVIESAVQRWLTENEVDVLRVVHERAGEMR